MDNRCWRNACAVPRKPLTVMLLLLPQRLELHAGALTVREQALAKSLSGSYPHGLLDSTAQIASHAGTSAATVVRFFAKLGYPSMAEVRREARSQLMPQLSSPAQRSVLMQGESRKLEECVDDCLWQDQHNLQATYDSLDWDALRSMVRALTSTSGRVFVLAERNSAHIGTYLATHLNMCRPQVHELDAVAPMEVDRLLWLKPEDVLLVFTIRRYSPGALKTASVFREQGCTVMAITDTAESPIVPLSHHWLRVECSNASAFDSYTAAYCLCNALVASVEQMLRNQVRQTLRLREQLWARWKMTSDEEAPRPKKAAVVKKSTKSALEKG